jgi:hypothetical protein
MTTQPLHYDCPIITDLLKHRMTGMSYHWLSVLNIMICILACTSFHDQQCFNPMSGAPDAGRCLLNSIGGCPSAVAPAAELHIMPQFSAIFSMLGRIAAQCSDINTRYQRQSFVQSGSPPDAADGAGHGARIQIRIAMQDPARTPGSRSEHLSKWISNRIFNRTCVDILLDMLG